MTTKDVVPKYHELMNPLIQALHDLGGSGSNNEIYQRVGEILELPEDVLNVPHDPEKTSASEVEYRLAWARTYLKKCGFIDNSARGIWVIMPEKRNVTHVDTHEVVRAVRAMLLEERAAAKDEQDVSDEDVIGEELGWRRRLYHILTKEISPDAFERLTKRLLRESGFVQIEVTGKSGDGGIDGKGIARLKDLLSFHVVFQCKRYQGSVSASQIRDFRGAMIGRADKGLFITTGTFTADAVREATRDGAPPIDLVDGQQLADMLKELRLGIELEMVEEVSVQEDWFKTI